MLVFDIIDGELVSPFDRWNPDLYGDFPDSGGGEDYMVDIDAESLETVVLEAEPPVVEEAFYQSVVPMVTGTPTWLCLGRILRFQA